MTTKLLLHFRCAYYDDEGLNTFIINEEVAELPKEAMVPLVNSIGLPCISYDEETEGATSLEVIYTDSRDSSTRMVKALRKLISLNDLQKALGTPMFKPNSIEVVKECLKEAKKIKKEDDLGFLYNHLSIEFVY